ncbi:NAD(P)H-binding protein [Fluviicola sp.]|uniref:SDR family oxidoreductase n=1 Tax=Fluviicola sp. TaxID=1917219 RepID=UPI0031E29BB3
MKVIVTGSLGHISKPLVKLLVSQNHAVTVISSNAERTPEIEALGATAKIGKVEDAAFLVSAFKGHDAAYCMLPPFRFFDAAAPDYKKEAVQIAKNYVHAIQENGIQKVVHLSSVGAEKKAHTGLLVFHYLVEQVFKELPSEIALTHIRPGSFDYNLYAFTDMIKGRGFLAGFVGKLITLRHYGLKGLLKGYSGIILSNYGAADKVPWVSPHDIAEAVSEELCSSFNGRKIRYVASEELTCQEVASILGAAVGKPYLKWVLISDKQMTSAMKQFGAPQNIALEFTEMNKVMHDGSVFEDYYKNRPAQLGKVKMRDFAQEFAVHFRKDS